MLLLAPPVCAPDYALIQKARRVLDEAIAQFGALSVERVIAVDSIWRIGALILIGFARRDIGSEGIFV